MDQRHQQCATTLNHPEENRNFLLEVYRDACFLRNFEARALELSKSSPPVIAGSMHLCAGQEVVPIAALRGLGPNDKVLSTYRGHGWAYAAGVDARSLMAELCHRATGVNHGRSGSALILPPTGRYLGENSIVGAGVPIACGVAMGEVFKETGNVVVVSIGDGAMNQGAVHEAMVFMKANRLPVILVCENNGWAEMTPTRAMSLSPRLSQRARAYGMRCATIDGTNAVSVRDTFLIAAGKVRAGEGPVLIECMVPRLWGHYNRDVEHYRSRQDKQRALDQDPLRHLERSLKGYGVDEALLNRLREEAEQTAADAESFALESPLPDATSAHLHVIGEPTASSSASSSAASSSSARTLSYIGAVNAGLRDILSRDPSAILYGEDVGKGGGIFGASKGLQPEFGEARVFDTPIAESAILGSAVGAALNGLKPVVEIMWADFMLVALDQLINQAANVRYLTEGARNVPMVVRTQQGATPGSCAQHSQSLEALLTHIPGLKIGMPANSQDAYDMLREAHADPDPCIVIESRKLYPDREVIEVDTLIAPVGKAKWMKRGSDVSIISWGPMVREALDAAARLHLEGIEVGVINLRWLAPVDMDALLEAAEASNGRVIVLHEAVRTSGFAGEIITKLMETCPSLQLRAVRLTTPDVRMPASPHLQQALLPNADTVVNSVLSMCSVPEV